MRLPLNFYLNSKQLLMSITKLLKLDLNFTFFLNLNSYKTKANIGHKTVEVGNLDRQLEVTINNIEHLLERYNTIDLGFTDKMSETDLIQLIELGLEYSKEIIFNFDSKLLLMNKAFMILCC